MANELQGRRIAFMIANEGAEQVGLNVLVTSRNPDDHPAFCKQLVEESQRQPG